MLIKRLTVDSKIADFLIDNDQDFDELINKYGLINIDLAQNIYEFVVSQIIGQMLSKKAAENIFNRFKVICNDDISPMNVNNLSIDLLKSVGISSKKSIYIKELTTSILDGKINFDNLSSLSEKEIIEYLTQIKGVGEWTAEMTCLFALGKENVFSYKDVALKNGIMKLKKYKTLSVKRFDNLRKKYEPYSSYASLYFYKINDDKEF